MSLLASVGWSRSGVRRRDDWTETCRAAVDGLGRRTASGYAGNWDDGPRNRTEAETHADRRVRPNAPPEEKDIGTAALRLIRDDCQAGSVRKLRHTLSAQREARKSEANPDNRERHRQASSEGTDNRQGECGKQTYLGARLLYRHGCLL